MGGRDALVALAGGDSEANPSLGVTLLFSRLAVGDASACAPYSFWFVGARSLGLSTIPMGYLSIGAQGLRIAADELEFPTDVAIMNNRPHPSFRFLGGWVGVLCLDCV